MNIIVGEVVSDGWTQKQVQIGLAQLDESAQDPAVSWRSSSWETVLSFRTGREWWLSRLFSQLGDLSIGPDGVCGSYTWRKPFSITLSPVGLNGTGLLWRFFPQLYWDVIGKLNGKIFKVYNMIHVHIVKGFPHLSNTSVDCFVLYPNPPVPVQSTHDTLTLLTLAPATCLPSAWSHLWFMRSHVAELTCYKACAKHV